MSTYANFHGRCSLLAVKRVLVGRLFPDCVKGFIGVVVYCLPNCLDQPFVERDARFKSLAARLGVGCAR